MTPGVRVVGEVRMGQRYQRGNDTVRTAASGDLAVSDGLSDRQVIDSSLGVEAAEATVGVPAGERFTAAESAVDVPGLLALLPAFEDEIEAGERRLRECVRLLRAHRATWREIGDALQVSRQAAWERFRTS